MGENEAVRDREARTLALYVPGALAGAHEEVAATVDSGASEEAANLAALNAALSGAGQGGGL